MKKLLVFIICVVVFSRSFSQVAPQTGSATFSLPMFSWQDSKSRLNLNIALNYNSGSGLKVTDVASNIGQGWNLLAGGVITRMQAGEPDDQKPRAGNGTIEDITKYPAGFLYSTESPLSGCPEALTKYPLFKDKNHLYKQHNIIASDRELDKFAFQFNGRTGLFVLDKKNINKAISLDENKLKIWFERNENIASQGIRTTITAYYIQDENGLIYKFSQLELSKVLRTKYCNDKLTASYSQPNFKSGKVYHEATFDENTTNPWVTTSWHLSEIKDPLTQRTITFSYTVRNINSTAGTAISYYKEKDYSIISHSNSITQTPVISNINFPDGHQVSFGYGNARVDLVGDYTLASVSTTYGGRHLSKYQLVNSYMILNRYGNPTTDYQKSVARLCLLSVKRIGVDLKSDEEPYSFDYYMGSGSSDDFVPPPFFHIKDVWGYYNGGKSVDYNNQTISLTKNISELNNTQLKGLCFQRNGSGNIALNPKTGYAKNGLLKQITYPTGGFLLYEYEQNQSVLAEQNINVGGIHVSKTKLVDGGYSNNCDNPITTNYAYTATSGSSTSSLWGAEMPQNSMVIYSYYSPEQKYFYYKPIFNFGCDYRFKYPGILSRDQSISLTAQQQFLLVISEVLNAVSGVMTIVDIVNLALGATPAAIVAVVIDVIGSIINIIISCFSNQTKNNTSTICYNSDLNGANPLPCQFRRVEVTESSGSNGKTVMEFTDPNDYALWEPVNPSFSKKQRFALSAYGLPKKTTIYDATGNKIKETENFYTTNRTSFWAGHPGVPSSEYSSCKCNVIKTSSQRSTDWSNTSSISYTYGTDDLLVDVYNISSSHTYLDSTYEKIYKPGSSQFAKTLTHYTYSSSNFQVNGITTTLSNGDESIKVITYSGDYTTGIFSSLLQNNIICIPVATTSAIIKANTGIRYTGETVTEFTALSNGNVQPYRTLEQRFVQPKPNWEMSFYRGPNDPSNPSYTETQNYTYNLSGNLIGMKDEGGRGITNIYDYDNKYVVASVINADPIADKSAYTSFETTGLGGWVLSGSANYSTSAVITGSRSLSLTAGNTISASLNTAKPYRLSFWASSSVTVNGGATLVKSAPVLNGSTYYEYNIAQGASSITITGTAVIDELRLAPQTARMRTVSYDPLIGKTSECDENNRITYYEYDKRGRLLFIKDDQKNIVKMYEYNIGTNLQKKCPPAYYNNAISEIYTKNNCPAGYIGGQVEYTIPANKYSSTISQADVDLQVEIELAANGQNFANLNGICIQVFSNVAKSASFTKEGCDIGYVGTSVTYTVPAGKYTSTISQADAEEQAQDEMDANGQAYANIPGNASCVVDNTPVWQGEGDPQTRCQMTSNGTLTGHMEVLVTDINPNSSTYNQTRWQDGGVSTSCPAPPCSTSTCQGLGFKCINGNCERATCQYIGSSWNGATQFCNYIFSWSDGSTQFFQLILSNGGSCPPSPNY